MSHPPFRMEGGVLPIVLPATFEAFYRSSLRKVGGSRLRARDLMTAYDHWSAANEGSSMTFSTLRRLMEIAGHRRVQSNGIHYLDVGLAADLPDLPDTLPNPFRGVAERTDTVPRDGGSMVGLVDAALASLLDLRRALVAADEDAAPHVAARRVLGLFDQ